MSEAVSALNGASFEGTVSVRELGLRGMITVRGNLASTKLKGAVKAAAGVAAPKAGAVALAGEDLGVSLWRVSDGARLAVFRGHRQVVRHLVFSADGQWLASGGDGGVVMVLPGSVDSLRELARRRLGIHAQR